ncbi:MAG: hypothetical protein LBC84_02330 [Prevotellaceae bacterium]|nr:hypothetical protein [Prevotellaceae bacterium]
MKRNRNKKEKVENEVVPSEKKSKITLYWEEYEQLGIPKGKILNMRAVLK